MNSCMIRWWKDIVVSYPIFKMRTIDRMQCFRRHGYLMVDIYYIQVGFERT